jgi:hypothetical protein
MTSSKGRADLLAAGVGHDTEGAVLAAALHHRDEGGRAVDAGLGQAVELLDLREADVDDATAPAGALVDHLRQPVQGLRAEDEVDVGRALADLALLAGHAAADADDQLRVALLPGFPAAELMRRPSPAPFSRIEQVLSRMTSASSSRPSAPGRGSRRAGPHARGVVLVHLAAVGFDVDLAAIGILASLPVDLRARGIRRAGRTTEQA